ncbi:MAG TPA: O-antigen ligase family protein [Marinobacter sp.]|uniref:O-antigen ligase family protein n=1 Tax=Marinobacter sp. TaxID=50741 RepID=UPI002D80CCEB|nr:O-antigen ligase family protein [Marinobacter sp.]HET8800083.1 O-antigen ligase family protein [Marinobacter sp.]
MSKFALLFLLLFFGGVVAALAYSGAAAFVVYQMVYFFNPDDRWWASSIPGLRYSAMASVLMLGVLAVKYKAYSSLSPWRQMPPLKWLAAILVMYYLAYLFAIDLVSHQRFTFHFAKLVIIVFVAYKLLHSKKALNASLWAYILGCSYIGYLAHVTGRNSQGRVEGIGMVDAPDANDTAAALVPAAALLLYFAWVGNKKIKLLCIFCGALIANGLVLINSRGAFLASVVSLTIFIFLMIFSSQQRPGQRFTAVLMIVIGVSGAVYVTDDLFWERMGTLQDIEDQDASGSSRMVFWWTTFDMLEDHPLGLGINGYNRLAPQYMDDETRGGVEYRSVHSLWFQGLSELGWIGFGFFCCLLISLFRLSRKAKKFVMSKEDTRAYFQILAIECALLGYLAAGTFINRFRAEILYWMILFLAVAIKVYYLQHQNVTTEARSPGGSKRLRKNRDVYT